MTPALAPLGWTVFASLDGNPAAVNTRVNARINGTDADANKPWRIIYGDEAYVERDGACHDFALTKRAELLGLGWPASRLLLCEVAYDSTENHMVLIVVRADGVELVLDNLHPDIVPWTHAGYRLVRRQSPGSPDLWEKAT